MPGGTTPPRVLSPLRLFATICVLVPTAAVLAVPTYDSATPRLGGFPFFYWYQLMWVVLTGVLMVAAYFAIRADERRRKAFRTAPAAGGPARSASGGDDGGEAGGAGDGEAADR
jgi:peptidoglycan/LPS O-acetylase OafA/YrhL